MRGNDDTGGSSRNPRVFGTKPVETEKTINLDDEGLLQLQKDEMKQHDEQLEQLLSVLKRQAQIGAAIGEELGTFFFSFFFLKKTSINILTSFLLLFLFFSRFTKQTS